MLLAGGAALGAAGLVGGHLLMHLGQTRWVQRSGGQAAMWGGIAYATVLFVATAWYASVPRHRRPSLAWLGLVTIALFAYFVFVLPARFGP